MLSALDTRSVLLKAGLPTAPVYLDYSDENFEAIAEDDFEEILDLENEYKKRSRESINY